MRDLLVMNALYAPFARHQEVTQGYFPLFKVFPSQYSLGTVKSFYIHGFIGLVAVPREPLFSTLKDFVLEIYQKCNLKNNIFPPLFDNYILL